MEIDLIKMELKELKKLSTKILILGILMMILGGIALSATMLTTLLSVALLGIILIAAGIVQFVQAFYDNKWSNLTLHLLLGISYFIVGTITFLRPLIGAEILTLMIAVLFIVEGIYRAIVSSSVKFPRWGWYFFGGILSLVLGALILIQWPTSGLWFIGTVIGVDLIYSGWSLIVLSSAAKSDRLKLGNGKMRMF
jgi:uncharacterized membrane protein HdeD (DUF308 family)